MNNPIFMRVDGTRQGQITAGATTAASIGNAWQDGHTDEATVKGYTHNITIYPERSTFWSTIRTKST